LDSHIILQVGLVSELIKEENHEKKTTKEYKLVLENSN